MLDLLFRLGSERKEYTQSTTSYQFSHGFLCLRLRLHIDPKCGEMGGQRRVHSSVIASVAIYILKDTISYS